MLLKETCPGVGGRSAFTIQVFFQNPGRWSSLKPMFLEWCLKVGRNAHFYGKHKTTNMDNSGQPGFVLSLKRCLGETCNCLRRVGLAALIRGEPAEGQEAPAGVLHPTARAQAGNHVQERMAAAWPRLRVLTVKASVH